MGDNITAPKPGFIGDLRNIIKLDQLDSQNALLHPRVYACDDDL